MSGDTRQFESSVEINATPETVWKAIAEGEGLARWFPLDARVKPGVGGSVWLSWGEAFAGEVKIEIWEPGRHLRTVDERAEGPGGAKGPWRIAVDYFIEPKKGGESCIVRLVHSGFGRGTDWNDEFDSISGGWKYELKSLKHYVERHGNAPRSVALAVEFVDAPKAEVWPKLIKAFDGFSPSRAEGDRYSLAAPWGTISGRVVTNTPGHQFAGTVESLDDALLRILAERMGPKTCAWLWLSIWGPKASQAPALQKQLTALLKGALTPDT